MAGGIPGFDWLQDSAIPVLSPLESLTGIPVMVFQMTITFVVPAVSWR